MQNLKLALCLLLDGVGVVPSRRLVVAALASAGIDAHHADAFRRGGIEACFDSWMAEECGCSIEDARRMLDEVV